MQQTETYKFNLIDTDDVFSPTPLNENAQALETQLARVDGEFARMDSVLAGRLRWKFGTYKGTSTYGPTGPARLEFDFKPLFLLIGHPTDKNYGGFPWVRGAKYGCTMANGAAHANVLTWTDNAVEWYCPSSGNIVSWQLNSSDVYSYLALGVEE